MEKWEPLLSILIQVIGIGGSLGFTAVSFRSEAKTRRIANQISITANHREVWKIFLNNKELQRVLDPKANTAKQPITVAERISVTLAILQISTVYFATQNQLMIKPEGWRRDISQFLSLPIPRQVWDENKILQNDDFVAFVESCRNWK